MKNIYKNLIIMLSIIFCLAIFSKTSYSQYPQHEVRKPKVYLEPLYSLGQQIVESYDNGFMIVANAWKENDLQNKQAYILKLDINGELLWSKAIGENDKVFVKELCTTEDGGFLIGGDMDYKGKRSAFLLKFDACAKTEWLTVLPSEEPNINTKLKKGLHRAADGGYMCRFVTVYGEKDNRECVVKLDEFGRVKWFNHLNMGPSKNHRFGDNYMLATSDGGCITGMLSDGNFNHSFGHVFLYKVSKDGEFEWKWEDVNNWLASSVPFGIIEEEDCFYSASTMFANDMFVFKNSKSDGESKFIRRVCDQFYLYPTPQNYTFLGFNLLKTDENKYLTSGFSYFNLVSYNDTGAILNIRLNDFLSEDTTFNDIIASVLTKDNLIAGFGLYKNSGQYADSLYKTSFWKFDHDLNYAPENTEQLKYDYLCNDNISDGIVMMPAPTNFLNAPVFESSKVFQLDIFPNPAKNEIFITLPDYSKTSTPIGNGTINQYKQFEGKYNVVLFDIQGKEVYNQEFVYNDISQKLDVSCLKSGMYLIKITQNNQEVAQGKFVKK